MSTLDDKPRFTAINCDFQVPMYFDEKFNVLEVLDSIERWFKYRDPEVAGIDVIILIDNQTGNMYLCANIQSEDA